MGNELPAKVAMDYIKSNAFRVVHADGVYGGITPRLDIFMAVWSERPALPKQMSYEVTEEGTIGPEIRDARVVRDVLSVREVEVGMVLDVALAKSMIEWLQNKIETLETLSKDKTHATDANI